MSETREAGPTSLGEQSGGILVTVWVVKLGKKFGEQLGRRNMDGESAERSFNGNKRRLAVKIRMVSVVTEPRDR